MAKRSFYRLAIGASGTLCALALPGALAAQTAGQGTPKPVSVTVGVDVEHHTNAARATADQAAARGLVRGDTLFRPNIDVQIVKPFGPNRFTLDGDFGYSLYTRNTRLNREHISVAGDLGVQAGPCYVDLLPSYTRQQTDLSQLAGLPGTGIDTVRNVESIQHYAAAARCGRDQGLSLTGRVERAIGDNSALLRRFSDYRQLRSEGGLRYARPVLGEFNISGGVVDNDYPNRPPVNGSADGFRQIFVNGSFRREIGANLRGMIQVGYSSLDPRAIGVPGFSGITWNAELTATIADRLQITGTAGRQPLPSLQSDAAFSVARDLGVQAQYKFSPRLSARLGYDNHLRSFPGAGTGLVGPSIGRSLTHQVQGSVDYDLGQHIMLSVFASYQKRKADAALFNYDDVLFGVRARYHF